MIRSTRICPYNSSTVCFCQTYLTIGQVNMHKILVCLCLSGLVVRGWTSEQSTERWKHPTHSGWWDDRYEPEETEASCCPIKKVGDRTYRMVGYNLTSAKQHDCKDGCIYHDSEGRETCFTQVSINIITNLYQNLSNTLHPGQTGRVLPPGGEPCWRNREGMQRNSKAGQQDGSGHRRRPHSLGPWS